MIICVSANPAIDRRLRIGQLRVGEVNRASSAVSFAGGKAAHVAMAAKALGEDKVVWVGFLGGATGDEVERQLIGLGIEVVPVRTRSTTRVNDEIIDDEGVITEILEPGGMIVQDELIEFKSVCERLFSSSGPNFHAVFSGSLPLGVPGDLYADLIAMAHVNGGRTTLDTSGEPLLLALSAKPDMIKPNREEAEKAIGVAITGRDTAELATRRFADLGVSETIISLGAEGLVRSNSAQEVVAAKPPKVRVNSTVGCGDATVAGLVVADIRGYELAEKLRLAVACGAANCLADLPGQIKLADVERLTPLVEISRGMTGTSGM
ncbi:MAG: hexose kinase [Acidobacteria bacterium]|nr:hexose kinase [Acidobacteriota bacterium]